MKTRGTVRLATRGSRLAQRQASLVETALEDRRFDVDLVTVETTGDRISDELIHRLGKTGAFVHELDERVLAGDVDGAVHSMKDVPTEQPKSLVTAAVPERGPPGDVLVTPDGSPLEALSEGATVGTSSLRRRAQLLSHRPDLTVEPMRGNVDTRLEKLLAPTLSAEHRERIEAATDTKITSDASDSSTADSDTDPASEDDRTVEEWYDDLAEVERRAIDRDVSVEYDAIVLAEAGLVRSGLSTQVDYHRLPPTEFVPAPGQGALAVTAVDSDAAREIQSAIDHPRSRVETAVERTLLAELGGGCIAPIGIYAVVKGEYVHVTVQVYDRDGEDAIVASRDLPIESHADAAREFATTLADRGARDVIDRARREANADQSDSTDGARESDEFDTNNSTEGA